MHDVNLNVFDFDYDLTWWAFLISADERVYSRFGGTDELDPSARLSVAALKHTMRLVLDEHQRQRNQPPPVPAEVRRPMDLFGSKGKCMHCHQVNEAFYKKDKVAKSELHKLRFLPLPENVGVSVSIDTGTQIEKVAAGTPAAKAGLRIDDVVRGAGSTPVRSQGDLMWALKLAPQTGRLPLTVMRAGESVEVALDLPVGWNSPDLSWRRSAKKLKQ